MPAGTPEQREQLAKAIRDFEAMHSAYYSGLLDYEKLAGSAGGFDGSLAAMAVAGAQLSQDLTAKLQAVGAAVNAITPIQS